MEKSRAKTRQFSPGTWRKPESRHTLLIAMAKDAEKLAAQGDRIRELRAFTRVSQETAAAAIGVTLRGYQRWERGEGEINSENIKKLATYFATTPDYIEYGIMQRARGDTPEPFGAPTLADIDQRLARLETRLDQLVALLQTAVADQIEAALAGLLKAPPSPEAAPPASSARRHPRRRTNAA